MANKLLDNEKWLYNMYIIKKLSTVKISKLCNCSPALVSNKLKKHNIKSRTIKESMIIKSSEISEASKKKWKNEKYRNKVTESINNRYQKDIELRKSTSAHGKKYWDNETKLEQSKISKQQWENKEYRIKIIKSQHKRWTEDEKNKQSKTTKQLWSDNNYRTITCNKIKHACNDLLWKSMQSCRSKIVWQRESYRNKQSDLSKKRWQEKAYRNKMARSMSKICKKSILDKITIKTIKNLGFNTSPISLGPWTFDAHVKLPDKKDLLIECQGDYWHNKKERRIRDRQKRTYFKNYLSDKYELIELWEHDFYCIGKIYNILQHSLPSYKPLDYLLNKTSFSLIDNHTLKEFFDSFHYLKKSKAGICYGLKFNNKITYACIFSYVTRKETADRIGVSNREVLELSRLASNPKYFNKNAGSYLISKSIKQIKNDFKDIKFLVTFADTTLGYTGSVYKSSNWKFDGEVKPTYWYIDAEGNYRHKKTVWDQAKRLKMTEINYADYCGLIKIKGKKLLRFIYEINR